MCAELSSQLSDMSLSLLPRLSVGQTHLKACGLSEELIDLMRPTIEREQVNAVFAHLDYEKLHSFNEYQASRMAMWLYTRIPILFRAMVSSEDETPAGRVRCCGRACPQSPCADAVFGCLLASSFGLVEMRQANPTKSTRELNRMAIAHLVYLMPGSSEEVCAFFVQSLPFDPANGGRVPKEEFIKCWNRHARLIFPSSHHKSTDKGTIYCAIL